MQSPIHLVHNNSIFQNKDEKSYSAKYLENGKLVVVDINTLVRLQDGEEQFIYMMKESFEVDSDDELTWMVQFEEPDQGMVYTFTNRGVRTHCWGDPFVLYGDDEEWKLAQEDERVEAMLGLKGI